jgi:tRNA nucleotidyltransferase/poly(A) polymerase
MNVLPIPPVIRRFAQYFANAGFSLYIVGGAVRDHLLGLKSEDYDFTTDALPKEVMKLFKHVIPTGIEHGTVTVHFEKQSFEVTTFRSEAEYLDGRHPSSVSFIPSLEEDLKRRDFTINAFAADCQSGRIIDLQRKEGSEEQDDQGDRRPPAAFCRGCPENTEGRPYRSKTQLLHRGADLGGHGRNAGKPE